MKEEDSCTLICVVYIAQTVSVVYSILVGGVYENKGQCKRPTAVLWLDMWMSHRARPCLEQMSNITEKKMTLYKVNM